MDSAADDELKAQEKQGFGVIKPGHDCHHKTQLTVKREKVQIQCQTTPTSMMSDHFNSFRPRQNGCHFADDRCFKCIFLNENVRISIKISLKFVPKGQMNKIPALVQIMAWRRPGDKPFSEPMMVSLLTHICVTRPQWVKKNRCQRHRDATFPTFLITHRFFLWSLTKRASIFLPYVLPFVPHMNLL